jgi:hypothetical protein
LAQPGLWLGVIGPPGSGKSHLGASALAIGKTVLFAAPLGELDSYPAAGDRFAVVPLFDENWRPSEGKFVSSGYKVLMDKLKEIEAEKEPPKVIVFDTMNAGPSDTMWVNIMSGYGTDDPRTLGGNSRQPYVTYGSRFTELMNRLDLFRFRTGCHIVSLWHEDIREAEGQGVARKETEGGKTSVHWDLARLPMMRGSLRQDVTKWCSLAFYVEPVLNSKPFRCKLLVTPDATRLAKSRGGLVTALQKEPEIQNDFPKLLQLVEKHRNANGGASK